MWLIQSDPFWKDCEKALVPAKFRRISLIKCTCSDIRYFGNKSESQIKETRGKFRNMVIMICIFGFMYPALAAMKDYGKVGSSLGKYLYSFITRLLDDEAKNAENHVLEEGILLKPGDSHSHMVVLCYCVPA